MTPGPPPFGVPIVGSETSEKPRPDRSERPKRPRRADSPPRRGAAVRRLALIGNHTPRRCGIATFTADLATALDAAAPTIETTVLAMNDGGRRYDYPDRVTFELGAGELAAYRRAADFLNVHQPDAVSLQHEYGIFGGPAGSHVLALLRELRMPIVTTLHTILAEPNPQQRGVMDELIALSERLVVMSALGVELLKEVHGAPAERIDLIPHGIAKLPSDGLSKQRLGVEGRRVLLTFGLLSPSKGLEYVLDALPAIVERFPDAVYVILGATHPAVRDRDGESYRLMLGARARRLGVADHVIFHDRFVSQPELNDFLAAADIYLTPYLEPAQITSGTLAFAVGSGKAVISTPYWYANELLAEGRGVLVPWRDPDALARASIDLFADDAAREEMCRRAAEYGRDMQWPAVARAYVASFERAIRGHAERSRRTFERRDVPRQTADLPGLDWSHLGRLTDDTGLLQHAEYAIPRREDGYCLDDNARALLVMALAKEARVEDRDLVRSLSGRYLAFVRHAWSEDSGQFRNFMSYSRVWLEDIGSEDSHGRAVWALGTALGRSADPDRQPLANALFHSALAPLRDFGSHRAWAFALLGIDEYLRAFEGDSNVGAQRTLLAERLLGLFQAHAAPDWPWFEERLTYCGARLSQALLVSGQSMQRDDMLDAGLRSLEWLDGIQHLDDGCFVPIGSNGFYARGGRRARYDQQPVEAASMVGAALAARQVTGDDVWLERARSAFEWFLGQNDLQLPLYDASTGGCRDGVHADRLNENQGAESTLSFLMALIELRAAETVARVPLELPFEAAEEAERTAVLPRSRAGRPASAMTAGGLE